MTRRFHPIGSLVVLVTWLLLNGSLSLGHLLFGALLGLLVPALLGQLWPQGIVLHRPLRALRLLVTLLGDIVIANLQVARLILGREATLRSQFIWVPLELRNPYAIATLAAMVTLTPGTVSADVTTDGRWLLVHSLDTPDETALVASIKQRYEAPLAEILP
uniref:Monovalent cation/H+ antiporter subunit E n=1 Tax=uncultured microorganism TaxID=358574 RepID=F8UHA1_9ZZZZ|nr:monovalent cation/H+ antiporter subunit E [uncultured microorganism]